MARFIFILHALICITHAFPSRTKDSNLLLLRRDTDITCGGRFSKAGDGYAKRPDGCSSVTDDPHQVPDKWGSANFGGVCDEHDRCYYTLGSSRDSCNNAFCDGLVHACKRAYCRGIPGCLPALFPACNVAATTYCDGVRAFAGLVYPAAQTLQTEYEQCIRDNGPVIVPGACSNGRPPGAQWQQGEGCGSTWWECRNGQIKFLHGMRSPCIEH
ncbi:hypothetical protein BGZ57DRAFT_545094 [Hyaloscypha finlandica]|nr:hypothetical protein BGZ57DRAFT_545094 [Hyaloscypha finlandica]